MIETSCLAPSPASARASFTHEHDLSASMPGSPNARAQDVAASTEVPS